MKKGAKSQRAPCEEEYSSPVSRRSRLLVSAIAILFIGGGIWAWAAARDNTSISKPRVITEKKVKLVRVQPKPRRVTLPALKQPVSEPSLAANSYKRQYKEEGYEEYEAEEGYEEYEAEEGYEEYGKEEDYEEYEEEGEDYEEYEEEGEDHEEYEEEEDE